VLKWLTTQAEGWSRPGPQLQPLGPPPYPLQPTGSHRDGPGRPDSEQGRDNVL